MATTISSRTPEGVPNHCPICDTLICIEPSQPPGDAPCPGCGTLLWFIRTSEHVLLYESRLIAPVREEIVRILCKRLGLSPDRLAFSSSFVEDMGADSLDLVELVMALEEEFGIGIPDEDAENIQTVGDAIDYIILHRREGSN
jgi:acyl carrier protein